MLTAYLTAPVNGRYIFIDDEEDEDDIPAAVDTGGHPLNAERAAFDWLAARRRRELDREIAWVKEAERIKNDPEEQQKLKEKRAADRAEREARKAHDEYHRKVRIQAENLANEELVREAGAWLFKERVDINRLDGYNSLSYLARWAEVPPPVLLTMLANDHVIPAYYSPEPMFFLMTFVTWYYKKFIKEGTHET